MINFITAAVVAVAMYVIGNAMSKDEKCEYKYPMGYVIGGLAAIIIMMLTY